MQSEFETKKQHLKYCCHAKQYHSYDACNMGSALKILPRVVIVKKCLKTRNSYKSAVNIINDGLYKRHLVFTTDNTDTDIRVNLKELENDILLPSDSLKIDVCITPATKLQINRRRHIFITSQHPSITFAVPIIVLAKSEDDDDISLPLCITFPSTTVEDFSYYKMIVYNKSAEKLQFSVKCSLPNLTFHAKSYNMKKGYSEILLKLYCKDLKYIANSLKFKFNTGDKYNVTFNYKPIQWSIFVDSLNINFDWVRFKRRKTQEFSICNESNTDIRFNLNFISPQDIIINEMLSTAEQNSESSSDHRNIDRYSYKHFVFEPNCGTIYAKSAYSVKISFCPIMHKDFLPNETEFSPFTVIAAVSISWKNETNTEARNIFLKGKIIGPEVKIMPEVLNINDVYFGEQQIAKIVVQNNDDLCDAFVSLCDVSGLLDARIMTTPENGLALKPNTSDVFHIRFYITKIGRFLINLEFKVRNGAKHPLKIKGHSKPVRVKCFPKIENLGVIPIAIPQKRSVLLINPLTVPITVQCFVREDGSETPLILNVHNIKEHLPITVKDPFNCLQQSNENNQESNHDYLKVGEEFQLIYDNEEEEGYSLLSVHSQNDDQTSCSTEFSRSALDLIPNMACSLVSNLKAINILDENEIEKKVIEEAVNVLLNTPYFSHMDKCTNYIEMDWDSLATDPQEIYYNTEIIYLKPRTGKEISIIVIPNVLGYHVKYIDLRVCPLTQETDLEESKEGISNDFSQIVNTNLMSSQLRVEWNCLVPEIIWDNIIIMKDQVYAGELYDFYMIFQNSSEYGGFFYYDVIPQSGSGTMKFSNNIWKYFIEPNSKIQVPCQVKFTKLGPSNLYGCIKFVGNYASYPFYIPAEVLPPRVNIFPGTISKTISVLEKTKLYVFIENATPTSTWFKLKLKDETGISIEPCGGQLAPTGQATYVTLNVLFQDPGIYKTILQVLLEFEIVEKIPITINVKGMPIFFEPEIRGKEVNFGHILSNGRDNNCDDKKTCSKFIIVINKGLRPYRLIITRTKNSSKSSCIISSTKAKITIKPNNFIIPAQSETRFNISICSSEATLFYSEFRIQLTAHNNIKHTESYRFTLTAEFIIPELSWNKREITMNYQRTHNYAEPEQWEIIKLTNNIENNVDDVKLKISGPFKIKELFEHQYEHELNFSMKSLETKEFFILLHKEKLNSCSNKFYEGNIMCFANLRVQKSVRLKVWVFFPKITLRQNQIILFTNKDEGGTYIELLNLGEIPAVYKWKKLREESRYINQEDDVKQAVSVVLSDILRMLELEIIDSVPDSETNMTWRYQKNRCLLKELNNPINVKEILYEIVENLDLNAKRYKLSYQTPATMVEYFEKTTILNRYSKVNKQSDIEEVVRIENSQENVEENYFEKSNLLFSDDNIQANSSLTSCKSSNMKACVYYTLDDICKHLKLEDSYDIFSMPSSETCELVNSVYFFEKCGLLQEHESTMCALHIPPIRKGFEVRAVFQLDVIGGNSQELEIILVNLDKPITIPKQNIYLGLKPWYERYRTTTCIENATNYQLSLKLHHTNVTDSKDKLTKIAFGFCNIVGNNKTLQLSALQNAIVKTEGILGFNTYFKSSIKIIVNESKQYTLETHGHGTMPMLTMAKNSLPLVNQQSDEIYEEYYLLKKIYYYEIFKTITEKDDDIFNEMPEEENDLREVQSICTDYITSDYETKTSEGVLKLRSDQNFLKLMRNYVFVRQNEDLPNENFLDQLLETEKFLNRLRYNSDTSVLLNSLYHNYLLHFKNYNEQVLSNLKNFNVQSLPFHLKTHILDMGVVNLNQFCKFILTLDFYGPGKLIAAASTTVRIPGLLIDFQGFENIENKNFTYYCTEDLSNSCYQVYRNIYEREINPKVGHAHSYDLNTEQQHQRIITVKDNKCHKDNCNSLNKSLYFERKNNFTHCKIAGISKYLKVTKINVILLFRPQQTYFEHNQNLEDYLFIDLHMGATLPILLRAQIVHPNRKDKSLK